MRLPPARHASTAAALASALLAVSCVVGRGGWPRNHDYLAMFERTEWFRRAFLAGDLFPVWTPFCFNGHGSPGPFFYHRLFYTCSGAIAAVTGSPRAAVVGATFGFLVCGGLGMARLGARLSWPPLLQAAAAALLVLAPYTFTDWLVRGAMAELAAGMLVPWLLHHALRAIDGERAWPGLAVVWVILFHAHLVVWMYASLVLALALLVAVSRAAAGAPGLGGATLRNAAATLVITALAVGVHALAVQRLSHHFALDQLRIYLPTEQFQPAARYLWAPGFHWGRNWESFSVEIGRAALAGIALLAPLALAVGARPSWTALALAGGTAAGGFALQLPLAAPLYLHLPFAEVIQFPWRLLAFMTPAVLVVLCELAASLLRAGPRARRAAAATAAAVVVAQLALTVQVLRIHYPWHSRQELAMALRDLDGPWSGNEFLLAGVKVVPPRRPFLATDGCDQLEVAGGAGPAEPRHFTRLPITVASARPCTLRSSQFASPFVTVEGAPPGALRRGADGTIEVHLPAGRHALALARRGVVRALAADLHGWALPPATAPPWGAGR